MSSAIIRPADQSKALWLSTIAFTVCFAVWTIFAIIGIQIKADLGLSDTQFGLLVGTPILTGSLIRLILGIWSDQYGGRIVYTLTMLSAAAMTGLLTFAYDYPTFLLAALGVGIAGAPSLSAWLTWRSGIRRRSRVLRSASSAPVTLARRSPSLRHPSSWSPTVGRPSRSCGLPCLQP
jgi:MFS family permease